MWRIVLGGGGVFIQVTLTVAQINFFLEKHLPEDGYCNLNRKKTPHITKKLPIKNYRDDYDDTFNYQHNNLILMRELAQKQPCDTQSLTRLTERGTHYSDDLFRWAYDTHQYH